MIVSFLKTKKTMIKEVLKVGLLAVGCAGAGYAGSEAHRRLNPPVSDTQLAEIDLDTRRVLLDIGDRYQMTNQRVNELFWGHEIQIKNLKREVKELQDDSGVNKPVPTPRPRPTVSERLKPMPTKTP